jgi:hypothetical protein
LSRLVRWKTSSCSTWVLSGWSFRLWNSSNLVRLNIVTNVKLVDWRLDWHSRLANLKLMLKILLRIYFPFSILLFRAQFVQLLH